MADGKVQTLVDIGRRAPDQPQRQRCLDHQHDSQRPAPDVQQPLQSPAAPARLRLEAGVPGRRRRARRPGARSCRALGASPAACPIGRSPPACRPACWLRPVRTPRPAPTSSPGDSDPRAGAGAGFGAGGDADAQAGAGAGFGSGAGAEAGIASDAGAGFGAAFGSDGGPGAEGPRSGFPNSRCCGSSVQGFQTPKSGSAGLGCAGSGSGCAGSGLGDSDGASTLFGALCRWRPRGGEVPPSCAATVCLRPFELIATQIRHSMGISVYSPGPPGGAIRTQGRARRAHRPQWCRRRAAVAPAAAPGRRH